MEQDAQPQTDVLYDFLYRDSSRITSYYAQIFGGHLTSLQETDSLRDSTEKGGKLDFQLVGGDTRSTKENLTSQTRTINPHDILTVQVLSELRNDNRFDTDVENAPHGSLILAQGTLLLIDRSMLALAVAFLKGQADEATRTAKTSAQKTAARAQKQLVEIMAKVELPSGFLLRTDDELNIVGTLKEDGMDEPISTYYFKHGTAGLAGVYMIGIKEVPSPSVTLPQEQLIGAAQLAAEGLKNAMFPPGSITVTPIALFREI
jgi:hypothetical protein